MKRKFWPLFALFIAGFLLLSGCAAAPTGWSGPVMADDMVYVGAMSGEVLAMNPSSRIAGHSFPQESEGEWSFSLGDGGGGGFLTCAPAVTVSIYGTPAVADGVVYVGMGNGKVYALDASDGDEIWEYPRDGFIGPIVGSPVIDNGILYIGSSDGKLYALDVDTGTNVWDFQTGDDIWASPAIHNGVVYISSFDHKLYAIDAQTGAAVWDSPFETGGAIASTPLVHNGTIYFGSFDSNFYALNLDGTEKWRFEEGGSWFWGQAVPYDDIIIAGCLDHKIYALDAEEGTKVWDYETGGPIRGDPALVGELVVFGSDDGEVYALAAATGALEWPKTLEPPTQVRAPIHAAEDVVYVHATNQNIYALQAENGNILWSFSPSQ